MTGRQTKHLFSRHANPAGQPRPHPEGIGRRTGVSVDGLNYCLKALIPGLSPKAMEAWPTDHAHVDAEGVCKTKSGKRVIRACVPIHAFGLPADLDLLVAVCKRWGIALLEDAAESLGSLYKERHTGTFGSLGTLSFIGNKIMTTGGGGMILIDATIGQHAKHLTTTAKRPHPFEFFHYEVGFNYRLPSLNAKLGCAQLEQLDTFRGKTRTGRLLRRALQKCAGTVCQGTSPLPLQLPAECNHLRRPGAMGCLIEGNQRKGRHGTADLDADE